jgi:hypothetical protein
MFGEIVAVASIDDTALRLDLGLGSVSSRTVE